jgi:hypothetical protein
LNFPSSFLALEEMNHVDEDALVEVKPLINIGNARISAESVKKVNEITTRLGNDIIKKD